MPEQDVTNNLSSWNSLKVACENSSEDMVQGKKCSMTKLLK
jgi:hypothetical protein